MKEKMIWITGDNLTQYCPLNPIALTVAEFGAMGSPGNIEVVEDNGAIYCFNLSCFHNDTLKVICPPLLECLYGDPNDWKEIDLGAGNHLFLKEPCYSEFCERLKEHGHVRPSWIYQNWFDIIQRML